jgi:hypothetical protein
MVKVVLKKNMIEIRPDILGTIPTIGSTIVFNPPKYKGLIYGKCIGFSSSGLPKVADLSKVSYYFKYDYDREGFYVPKTGFVCILPT